MAASIAVLWSKTLENFATLTDKPEKFLSVQDKSWKKLKTLTKEIYDSESDCLGSQAKKAPIPDLIVGNFDDEQIWQQLELRSDQSVTALTANVARLLKQSSSLSFSSGGYQNATKTKKRKSDLKVSVKQDIEPEDEFSEDNLVGDIDEEDVDTGSSSDDSHIDKEIEKIKSRLKASKKTEDFGSDSDLDFDFPNIGEGFEDLDNDGSDDQEEPLFKNENSGTVVDVLDKPASKNKKSNQKARKTEVDDKFFKLSEMENFLEDEDAKEMKRIRKEEKGSRPDEEASSDDDEDVDMFGELSDDSEDEKKDLHYEDFFDPPMDTEDNLKSPGKKVRFTGIKNQPDEETEGDDYAFDSSEEEGEESEGEEVTDIVGGMSKNKKETKSAFEERQEKLKVKIKSMEDVALKEKPWQMSGEVGASARPENSLLEEHLQFEHTTRLAPVITEETTQTLEELIKQRIKDKVWDDVERKEKPKEDPYEYKKRIVLDQEKSKQSLAEIYEQEYIKLQQNEEEEKEDPKHEEIRKNMKSLFLKLDALSNFHYTPKPPVPEVKIVSNMPSISLEEVAPVSVSDAQLLAPEEIQEKKKGGAEKGKTEMTATDKKRERRKKKMEKRIRRKEREKKQKLIEKLNPGLGNKYSKEKAMRDLEKKSKLNRSGVTVTKEDKKGTKGKISSKSFFSQLQDEVSTQVKTQKAAKRKNNKTDKLSAKKLKL